MDINTIERFVHIRHICIYKICTHTHRKLIIKTMYIYIIFLFYHGLDVQTNFETMHIVLKIDVVKNLHIYFF